MNYKNSFYYLIDTPGHVDFSPEMERSIQVMDYAIILISAVEGIEGHTETVFKKVEVNGGMNMNYLYEVMPYIVGVIIIFFLFSLVNFFFYKKRKIDKVKILQYIIESENAVSTYTIYKNIFKNEKLNYVNNLLNELGNEGFIKETKIGSSNSNGLWEYEYGDN